MAEKERSWWKKKRKEGSLRVKRGDRQQKRKKNIVACIFNAVVRMGRAVGSRTGFFSSVLKLAHQKKYIYT